jgi:hypothetical protein
LHLSAGHEPNLQPPMPGGQDQVNGQGSTKGSRREGCTQVKGKADIDPLEQGQRWARQVLAEASPFPFGNRAALVRVSELG